MVYTLHIIINTKLVYVNTKLHHIGIFKTVISMIGKALKYMRKNKKLKQDVLAKEIDISQQNLSRYENEQRIISFDTIEQIANKCGYEIYFINKKTKDKFQTNDLTRKDI